MRVFRFMSKDEFDRFNNGEILINNVDHKKVNFRKTESKGFCFINIKDYTPHFAIHFLSGIVNTEICAIFEVDKKKLNKSFGIYAKVMPTTGNALEDLFNLLYGEQKAETFKGKEYCTEQYSKEDFKLIKYTEKCWEQWEPTQRQKDFIWKEI